MDELLGHNKFCHYTPRTHSSLWRIIENLLKFAREYGDIYIQRYKNNPYGGYPEIAYFVSLLT